jgi:hypothetical protein
MVWIVKIVWLFLFVFCLLGSWKAGKPGGCQVGLVLISRIPTSAFTLPNSVFSLPSSGHIQKQAPDGIIDCRQIYDNEFVRQPALIDNFNAFFIFSEPDRANVFSIYSHSYIFPSAKSV